MDKTDLSHHVVYNSLLLGKILQYLDLPFLKSCCLVCHLWRRESLRKFNGKEILVSIWPDKLRDPALPEIASFLRNNGIKHNLYVSLLHFQLHDFHGNDENKLLEYYYTQRNQLPSSFCLLDYLSATLELVDNVWLEMVLLDGEDAALLGNILGVFNNRIKFLSVDLAAATGEGIPSQGVQMGGLDVLRFRMHNQIQNPFGETDLNKFLRMFNSIRYLQLEIWQPYHILQSDAYTVSKCLLQMSKIRDESVINFSNFLGVQVRCMCTQDDFRNDLFPSVDTYFLERASDNVPPSNEELKPLQWLNIKGENTNVCLRVVVRRNSLG